MRLLYKPFAIIAGIFAARIGRGVFKTLWGRIDSADPPDPKNAEATMPKVVAAAALEAATMAGVAAAVDRTSAQFFQHLTGFWPAKKRDKKTEDDA